MTNNLRRYLIYIIGSFLTCFAILIDQKSPFFITTIIFLLIYQFYSKYYKKYKNNIYFTTLAIIFSLFMVVGRVYHVKGSISFLYKGYYNTINTFLSIFGYIILFNLFIKIIYHFFISFKTKPIKHKIIEIFKENPFKFSFITLLICYLPYLISFYPVIINYDAANQIKEVMGIQTRYLDSIVVLKKSVYLTNFNPLMHTLILGGLFKVGYILGSINFGLFLYSIIQMLFVISVFSYSINYMYKRKMNLNFILGALIIYGVLSVFPMYSITAVKDVFFSGFLYLYIIKLYDFIKYDDSNKNILKLIVLSFFIMMFRNNGYHTLVLSIPFLLFLNRNKTGVLFMLIFVISFNYTYLNIILPKYNIPNTSIREVLSAPFQQTARYVKYHDNLLSNEDKLIIDKVLGYEDLGKRYKKGISDPVKNKFNKNSTNDDLKEYYGVWYKGLKNRPITYLDATMNNIYGYFYPEVSKWYIYSTYNTKLKEAGFDYHYNSLKFPRLIIKGYGNALRYVPVIGLILNIAINFWFLLLTIVILIVGQKAKYINLIIPLILIVASCLVGPVNTYFRYILPLIFIFPFLFNLLYFEINE